MIFLEQIGVLVVLLAMGGFLGWAIYCIRHTKHKIPPRLIFPDTDEVRPMCQETTQDFGEQWNWPTTPPSKEIFDQFNARPWARRDSQ